jgi:hypothetical protein
VIPISADSTESRVQSVSLDAVSMIVDGIPQVGQDHQSALRSLNVSRQ